MKIRLRCTKHQVDLENFEGSDLLFSRSEPGVLELDLSDYSCPQEDMEEDELNIPKDDCSWSWRAELLHYSAYVGEDPYPVIRARAQKERDNPIPDDLDEEALATGLDDASGE